MNGKTAKRLRRIARELELPAENSYAPFGELRRLPERTYVDRRDGKTKTIPGGVLRRPFALKACERKAYQEAKNLYINRVEFEPATPNTRIVSGGVALEPPERLFKDRVVDSIKTQEPSNG